MKTYIFQFRVRIPEVLNIPCRGWSERSFPIRHIKRLQWGWRREGIANSNCKAAFALDIWCHDLVGVHSLLHCNQTVCVCVMKIAVHRLMSLEIRTNVWWSRNSQNGIKGRVCECGHMSWINRTKASDRMMDLIVNIFKSSCLRETGSHRIALRHIEDWVLYDAVSLSLNNPICSSKFTVFFIKPAPLKLLLALSGVDVPLSGVLKVVGRC